MPKKYFETPQERVLPSEVAELYEVSPGVLYHFVCAEFGEVDLRTITLELAERLAEKGYLKRLI